MYDSITNSVFDGQVLAPLLQRLAQDPTLTVTILSFEKPHLKQRFYKQKRLINFNLIKNSPPNLAAKITDINKLHPRLSLIIKPKISFLGRLSLSWPIYQLRQFLTQNRFDQVLLRGPLAGYLWYKAAREPSRLTAPSITLPDCIRHRTAGIIKNQFAQVTIQARGLAAAEYEYEHRTAPWYTQLWHRWRAYELERIEQLVYGPPVLPARPECSPKGRNRGMLRAQNVIPATSLDSTTFCSQTSHEAQFILSTVEGSGTAGRVGENTAPSKQLSLSALPYQIEAVSPALKTHLTQYYQTPEQLLTVAHQDLPTPQDPQQLATWRQQVRTQLQLTTTQTVYCYSGSAKAWQCPQETIQFFQQQLQQDPTSVLCILTTDLKLFQQLLAQSQLPATSYRLLQVPHRDIYQYLAACDVGIIFREAHLLNWISRPTKILEYQSVGLKIVHNQTIAMLN